MPRPMHPMQHGQWNFDVQMILVLGGKLTIVTGTIQLSRYSEFAPPRRSRSSNLSIARYTARHVAQDREILIEGVLNARLPLSTMPESVIRDAIEPLLEAKSRILGIGSEQRCIYLLPTRLNLFASISEGKIGTRVERPGSFRLSWMSIVADHWALLIDHEDGPQEGSILCQLIASHCMIEFEATENPTLIQGAWEERRFIGFTMCSNDEITEQSRGVIRSMRPMYNVLNNNCQTFCNHLFDRIRLVTSPSQLFAGRGDFHSEDFKRIVKRRAMELIYHILESRAKSKTTQLDVGAVPPSLSATTLILINTLTLLVSYFAWYQLSGGLFSALMLALVLHNFYGNYELYRFLLQKFWWSDEEDNAKDEIAKLADEVIDQFKALGVL